jgi:hypothetical protein
VFSVEVDRSNRLLVIRAAQHVSADEVKKAAEQVRQKLQNFAPGFKALTDLHWLESMDSSAADHIAEIMDILAEKKVGLVVRVVPDPHKDIGFNILSQFHYGPEIQITTFETLADAIGSLEQPAEGGA